MEARHCTRCAQAGKAARVVASHNDDHCFDRPGGRFAAPNAEPAPAVPAVVIREVERVSAREFERLINDQALKPQVRVSKKTFKWASHVGLPCHLAPEDEERVMDVNAHERSALVRATFLMRALAFLFLELAFLDNPVIMDCYGHERTVAAHQKLLDVDKVWVGRVPPALRVVGAAVAAGDVARHRPDAPERADALLFVNVYDVAEDMHDEKAPLTPEVVLAMMDRYQSRSAALVMQRMEGDAGVCAGEAAWIKTSEGKYVFRPDAETTQYVTHYDLRWCNEGAIPGIAWRVDSKASCLLIKVTRTERHVVVASYPRAARFTKRAIDMPASGLTNWCSNKLADIGFESLRAMGPRREALIDQRMVLSVRASMAAKSTTNYSYPTVHQEVLRRLEADEEASLLIERFPDETAYLASDTAHEALALLHNGPVGTSPQEFLDQQGNAVANRNGALRAVGAVREALDFPTIRYGTWFFLQAIFTYVALKFFGSKLTSAFWATPFGAILLRGPLRRWFVAEPRLLSYTRDMVNSPVVHAALPRLSLLLETLITAYDHSPVFLRAMAERFRPLSVFHAARLLWQRRYAMVASAHMAYNMLIVGSPLAALIEEFVRLCVSLIGGWRAAAAYACLLAAIEAVAYSLDGQHFAAVFAFASHLLLGWCALPPRVRPRHVQGRRSEAGQALELLYRGDDPTPAYANAKLHLAEYSLLECAVKKRTHANFVRSVNPEVQLRFSGLVAEQETEAELHIYGGFAVRHWSPAHTDRNKEAMVYRRLCVTPIMGWEQQVAAWGQMDGPLSRFTSFILRHHGAAWYDADDFLQIEGGGSETYVNGWPEIDLSQQLDDLYERHLEPSSRLRFQQGRLMGRPTPRDIKYNDVIEKVDETLLKDDPAARPIFTVSPHAFYGTGPSTYVAFKRMLLDFSARALVDRVLNSADYEPAVILRHNFRRFDTGLNGQPYTSGQTLVWVVMGNDADVEDLSTLPKAWTMLCQYFRRRIRSPANEQSESHVARDSCVYTELALIMVAGDDSAKVAYAPAHDWHYDEDGDGAKFDIHVQLGPMGAEEMAFRFYGVPESVRVLLYKIQSVPAYVKGKMAFWKIKAPARRATGISITSFGNSCVNIAGMLWGLDKRDPRQAWGDIGFDYKCRARGFFSIDPNAGFAQFCSLSFLKSTWALVAADLDVCCVNFPFDSRVLKMCKSLRAPNLLYKGEYADAAKQYLRDFAHQYAEVALFPLMTAMCEGMRRLRGPELEARTTWAQEDHPGAEWRINYRPREIAPSYPVINRSGRRVAAALCMPLPVTIMLSDLVAGPVNPRADEQPGEPAPGPQDHAWAYRVDPIAVYDRQYGNGATLQAQELGLQIIAHAQRHRTMPLIEHPLIERLLGDYA